MNIRQPKNDKGFTLIEIIATIAILTMVIGVLSALIIQLIRTDTKTTEQLSLSQKTNILISELRNQYESENFTLTYTKDGELTFPNRPDNYSLQFESLTITNGDQVLTNTPGSTLDVEMDLPLSVSIITKNKDNKTFELETKWDNFEDYPLSITIDPGSSSEECDGLGNLADFKKLEKLQDKIKVINPNTPNKETIKYEKEGSLNKLVTGDVIFSSVKFEKNGSVNITINGNVFVDNEVIFEENGSVNLTINGNVFLNKNIKLEENSSMNVTINGNAFFNGEVKLEKNPNLNITIRDNALFYKESKFEENNKVKMTIQGNSLFKYFVLEDNKNLEIISGNNLRIDNSKLEDNKSFNIKAGNGTKDTPCAVHFTNEKTIFEGSDTLNIYGKTIFDGKVEVKDEFKLYINGEKYKKTN